MVILSLISFFVCVSYTKKEINEELYVNKKKKKIIDIECF